VAGESELKRRRKAPVAVPGRATEAEDTSRRDAAERRTIEAAQRDPSCFAELYENNFERVYAFVARRVGDRDQAQDLTADVFHNALKNLARFEWRGVPFAAWLYRIAANAIAERGRRATQFEAIKARKFIEPDQSSEADLLEVEHRARLFKLVDRLPLDQRRVITMRFAQQKSIAEIAGEVGRSEGAIKQLQFRGLQSLRTMVGAR
jgi:RNA polymerase sigma-70 factor (ECF subfamily)